MSIWCQACNNQKHGVKGSPLTEHTCKGTEPLLSLRKRKSYPNIENLLGIKILSVIDTRVFYNKTINNKVYGGNLKRAHFLEAIRSRRSNENILLHILR